MSYVSLSLCLEKKLDYNVNSKAREIAALIRLREVK